MALTTKQKIESVFKDRLSARYHNPDGVLLIGTPEEIIEELCRMLSCNNEVQ